MKDGSQTRSGADTLRAELLKPKNKIRVGFWNVRTLYQAGKLQQVLQEMENYSGTFMCERSKMDRLREEDPVLGTHHTLFRLIR